MQAADRGYEAGQVLYMAMELSNKSWRLCFSNGSKIRQKSVEARRTDLALAEIQLAKQKLGLAGDVRVVSCFEAGRDGHWIHRWLSSVGVEALMVDASSIERPQGRKHVKTDRKDVEALLDLLMRYCNGFRRGFKVVRVPDEAAEAAMRLHREDAYLVRERSRLVNRISGLLVAQSVTGLKPGKDFVSRLEKARRWNGEGLSNELKAELKRLHALYMLVDAQLREIASAYELEVSASTRVGTQRRHLEQLKGVGPKSSRVLSSEAFAWRTFKNTKEVGSMAGLTPTPSQSGDESRDQGIGKHGNRRIRQVMVELSWGWLRWQPESELSEWFWRRFGHGGARQRRVGIVALARKLLVALWRYVDQGVVPMGARLKAA